MSLDAVREVADAVLYEGYLLYPYRASSSKNQSRWQFGVLGPPHASAACYSEPPGMSMQCLLTPADTGGFITVHLRFLQLQVRQVQQVEADGSYVPTSSLSVADGSVLTWDEAVEREITLAEQPLSEPLDTVVDVAGGQDIELVGDVDGKPTGRIMRSRWPLTARVRMHAVTDEGHVRLTVSVENEHAETVVDKNAAIRSSLIGAHVVLQAREVGFVSLLDPPAAAVAAAGRCRQERCWPVLAGAPGSTDVVLGAPIILYDYPEVAEQSQGALYDSTEIDEILTLRVMTMTDQEKDQARATDPRAAAIIDRCDAMSATDLQQLHGVLRNPRAPSPAPAPAPDLSSPPEPPDPDLPHLDNGGVPWWDPEADASVQPDVDSVVIDGVSVAKGSFVRVHPSRRADAQDLFFTDQVAQVTAVLSDVDGDVHVALVLVDDPAADLHEWYGRYLYFAPDELEPLPAGTQAAQREESRS